MKALFHTKDNLHNKKTAAEAAVLNNKK